MLAKTILSSCSNIKSIFESNISTINSIKQFTEEIFQLTSGKPMPNRIDLISKKTTTMLRKEKTLLNSNRELSSNIDKIEKDILDLLKNIYNSQQINEQDIFKEITENIQRKNNELTKIKNINENLNLQLVEDILIKLSYLRKAKLEGRTISELMELEKLSFESFL
jgi:hypothetical protein